MSANNRQFAPICFSLSGANVALDGSTNISRSGWRNVLATGAGGTYQPGWAFEPAAAVASPWGTFWLSDALDDLETRLNNALPHAARSGAPPQWNAYVYIAYNALPANPPVVVVGNLLEYRNAQVIPDGAGGYLVDLVALDSLALLTFSDGATVPSGPRRLAFTFFPAFQGT